MARNDPPTTTHQAQRPPRHTQTCSATEPTHLRDEGDRKMNPDARLMADDMEQNEASGLCSLWPRGEWTEGEFGLPDVGQPGWVSLKSKGGMGWNGMVARFDCGDYARSKKEGAANAQLFIASPLLAEVVRRGLSAGVFKGHLKEAAEAAYRAALDQDAMLEERAK